MNRQRALMGMVRGERGMVLPLVLVFLGLGLLLLTPTLGHGYTALSSTTFAQTRGEEVHAVDSGLEEGIRWLLAGKPLGGEWSEDAGHWVRTPYLMNGKSVFVTVSPLETEHTYEVSSWVLSANGQPLTLFSRVKVVPGELPELEDLTKKNWPGDVYIPDGGSLPSGYHIGGTLYAAGDVVLENGSRVADGASITGDLTLSSGSKIDGVICVSTDDEDGTSMLTIDNGSKPADAVTIFLTLQDGEYSELVIGSGSGNAGRITMLYVVANGSSALDVTVSNGTIDVVYIVSSAAAVTIDTNDADDIGGVYATTPGNVTYNDGDGDVQLWDGVSPATPECPEWPKPVADVETYEFA